MGIFLGVAYISHTFCGMPDIPYTLGGEGNSSCWFQAYVARKMRLLPPPHSKMDLPL